MNPPVVTGSRVTKRYGSNTVLDSMDITIPAGVNGLLGANGSGKTTFLGLLLGLHRADDGDLTVLGVDPVSAGPEVRGRIGYAPENHNLPPDLPASDFVQHLAEVHGMPRTESVARASDALFFVGLGEERLRPLGTLSTGQRQRVKLAMAIAHDPELVILDEPTDGLDPTQRESMLDLIRRLGSEFGMSVLLSSHLLDEVERTCDHVVIIDSGGVVAAGGINELRGEGRGLSITVDRGQDELARHLETHGISVRVDGPHLALTSTRHDETQLLVIVRDAIADLSIPLRKLQNRTMSLEDVYLLADRQR